MAIEKRKLGKSNVFPLALGCMGMSPGTYGAVDEKECTAVIHEAVERGVEIIDTGDFYAMGHNEMLVGRALEGRRDKVKLSVKFGALRGPDGSWLGFDGRPEAVKTSLAYSLQRLKTDYIDIYRPARLDPRVPIEETIGAIQDMIKAGYVREVSLSEVGVDTIRRAHKVSPVTDLQIEYSLLSRNPEKDIFPALEELGIAVTAYGVVSRGLLSNTKPTGPSDFRAHLPRFQEENRAKNQKLVDALNEIAESRKVTSSQLAIAWVLAKKPYIFPTVGIRKRPHLIDALAAIQLKLTPAEMERIEKEVPASAVAGERYPELQMEMLDSEKPVAK